MKQREWRWIDKKGWGAGPWQDEPDKLQWQDEATGYPCIIRRNEVAGNWCGYVGVPETHPMYNRHYDYGYKHGLETDVHGGLTYADFPHEEDGDHRICHFPEPGDPVGRVYWLGFDCHHGGDSAPGMEAKMRGYKSKYPDHHAGDVYRTQDFVMGECRKLASQLHAMGYVPAWRTLLRSFVSEYSRNCPTFYRCYIDAEQWVIWRYRHFTMWRLTRSLRVANGDIDPWWKVYAEAAKEGFTGAIRDFFAPLTRRWWKAIKADIKKGMTRWQ